MGYQAVIAALPVLLVMIYHAPVYVYGTVMGVSYGLGSFLGYIGGRLADRYGRKRVAILGNALIPLLSLSGIATSMYEGAALFVAGWLSRNFRSPARKALISQETDETNRGKVFGFLNALDVGGGVISIAILLALLRLDIPLSRIILATAIPIAVATALLIFVEEKMATAPRQQEPAGGDEVRVKRGAYVGVIAATSLYGFSFYSLGFPILTIVQSQRSYAFGFASYLLFLLASALFGYIIGSRRLKLIPSLGLVGYTLSAIGTLLFGLTYIFRIGLIGMYISVVIIGMAVGTIDTLEPSLLTQIKPEGERGRGMGALTSARSLGLLMGNIIMGVLYYFGPFYSYVYATMAALAAGAVLLSLGRGFKGMI